MSCHSKRCVGFTARLCFLIAIALGATPIRAESYPDRLVWVFGWNLDHDSDVTDINQLLETAAKHDINGAVFSLGLGSLSQQNPDYFRRLDEVMKTCQRLNVEFIPSCFSIGYGNPALNFNKNLAEGLPVQDAPFLVSKGEARLVPDEAAKIPNGDFEQFKGNQFASFDFIDEPGKISFVDTQVKHGGRASLRLENFTADPNGHGHGRASLMVHVKPHRVYRMSLWVKTQGLEPANAFQLLALAPHERDVSTQSFSIPSTGDWKKLTTLFNSLDNDTLQLYTGVWEGKAGKLWIDDWTLDEVGPINVLRRPGTPVTVKSEDGATTYVEGKDYAPLKDPNFIFWNVDRPAPPLRLAPGSAIKEGQRLRVSWYHPMIVYGEQVTVCMAEPELYEIFDREAKILAERVHPRRVMLGTDEIRMGGTCAACRGKDMAQLLGQCITRQEQIFRKYLPDVQVYAWSDMLDPNHNAHPNYYLVQGDFTGSWKYVPKDLIMSVWGGAPEEKSLHFFDDQGFQMLVGCYYDADDLNDVKGWLHAAQGIPRVRGFMYTPWEKKYKLLGDFGELLKDKK